MAAPKWFDSNKNTSKEKGLHACLETEIGEILALKSWSLKVMCYAYPAPKKYF